MSKLEDNYNSLIDSIFYNICEKIAPIFKKYNFTPNQLTTIKFLIGILAIKYLLQNNKYNFIYLMILSYFFDCLDGFYARKYNLSSDFGAYYDSLSDWIIYGIIIYIYYKNKQKEFYKFIPYALIIYSISLIKKYNINLIKNNEINILNNKNQNQMINNLKLFGEDTKVVLIIVFALIYY